MPVYEYACTACGERTEAKQSFDDPPLDKCPVCGGKLRKLYSPVGIVFKGSGFYSTDQKSESGKKTGSAADKPSEPKSTDTKSDSKSSTESAKPASAEKSA